MALHPAPALDEALEPSLTLLRKPDRRSAEDECRVELLALLSELESAADKMSHRVRMARREVVLLTGGAS